MILPPDAESIAEAAGLIGEGGLVAFPTETVYGLGADATNDAAVAGIFAAKGRPRFNPLIVHLPDAAAAQEFVEIDSRAHDLMDRFWPGALTFVLKRRPECRISLLASAGLDTLAVRVPDHPVARALLKACSAPLAAPSANRSEEISPTTAAHVVRSLGDNVAAVLDGGPCRVGLESTVIDLSTQAPTLLRPGGIPAEEIEALIAPLAPAGEHGTPKSPGMTTRHYAPSIPLRMGVGRRRENEALLAFGEETAEATLNLSPSGDLREAAANLFAMLRRLDDANRYDGIAVSPIPDEGLGRAINDRLQRAAGKKRS